jgi:hypothetical protein
VLTLWLAAATGAHAACNLDVDDNGRVETSTDVVYVARHLFGLPPVPPSFRQMQPGIPSDATVAARIQATRAGLDVDGSGQVGTATDVVYIARRLFGIAPVPPSFRAGQPGIPADAVIAAAVDACLPGATTTTTTTRPTTTTTTTRPISFAAEIQPIFTANCALSFCHAGPFPQADLDLSAGNARASLVDQPSEECLDLQRVAPGMPEASYLVFKLRGFGSCFLGEQMPRDAPPLSASDQAKIARWIREGALGN